MPFGYRPSSTIEMEVIMVTGAEISIDLMISLEVNKISLILLVLVIKEESGLWLMLLPIIWVISIPIMV